MNAEIKKIVIEVGGKEIELTEQEAQAVFEKLDSIFGKPVVYVNTPVYPIPVVVEPPTPIWNPSYPSITCGLGALGGR